MRSRDLHTVPILCCLVMSVALLAGCSGTASAPPASGTAKPLEATLSELARSDPAYAKLRAVLVKRDGRTVFEQYYASSAADHHDVFSVTKSVLSALVGIAVADGDLALDDTLAELLPEHRAAMDRATARVTLAQLLSMTGGFDEGVDLLAKGKDWVRPALRRHDAEVGEFTYSNDGAYLVGVVLAEAVDRDLLDYARERLFDPIGVDSRPGTEPLAAPENLSEYERAEFAWPVDPQGVNIGAAFLRITPREMLAFGTLFLDGGKVDGKQVVPAGWVRDSTRSQVQLGGGEGYGYLWWTGADDGEPAFSALGYGGQQIAVIPNRKTVVVIVSDADVLDPTEQGVADSSVRVLLDDFILPAVR